jgi:predicted nuclease of restriction endonuclease-like (RecB) superfamily
MMMQPPITPEIARDFAEISQIIQSAREKARKIASSDPDLMAFLRSPIADEAGDLHRKLLRQLKDFVCESEPDLCLMGFEYPLQVGMRDFALDLLFFHRGLNCLVAILFQRGYRQRAKGRSLRARVFGQAEFLPGGVGSGCAEGP